MNIIILIEQSYIDSNIQKHLRNHFKLRYELTYVNKSYGGIIGNVASLVGYYDDAYFHHNIIHIINDLEKYSPFIKLLALNFNRYWIPKSKFKLLKGLMFTSNHYFITSHLNPVIQLNSSLEGSIKSIIYLLEKKKTE